MLRLLAVTAPAVVAVLTASGAAAAAVTLPLHSSHRNVLATQFVSGDCAKDGQIPPAGSERWVFVLPHNDADFVNLTLSYKNLAGTTITVKIPNGADPYPDGITSNGTSKAWVILPSGWTLLDGSATVSGPTKAAYFNLTHTCVGPTATATPSRSPSKSPSSSPSCSPSASNSPSGSTSVSPSPSRSASGGASTAGSPSGSTSTTLTSNSGSLPLTGFAISGFVAVGLAAIGLGAGLLWLRRRRDTTAFTVD
jgi:LPXTG-motif cell wall-anchored protein